MSKVAPLVKTFFLRTIMTHNIPICLYCAGLSRVGVEFGYAADITYKQVVEVLKNICKELI